MDDDAVMEQLEHALANREVVLIAPGKTSSTDWKQITEYIQKTNAIVIGINAINPNYTFDYLYLMNTVRYNYAKEVYPKQFGEVQKILLSNIKTSPEEKEMIVNFNRVIKRGWKHFDNAVINALRLLDKLHVQKVSLAGFDGFKHKYNESYADAALPTLNPDNKWDELNEEINDMFQNFKASSNMKIAFLTESIFDHGEQTI